MKRILFVLLFVAVCSPVWSQTLSDLMYRAESLLENSRPDEAASIFEQIVALDNQNYDALAFLCNYQFALGMKSVQELEQAYKLLKVPTRMQTAKFENALRTLYDTRFKKAEDYLIRAYLLQRNDYLDAVAEKIAAFKRRIGIEVQGVKKPNLLKKLVS